MQFKDLQRLVYEEYKKNGFEEFFNQHKELGDLAETGLFHTEISELQEGLRDGILYGLELADIIIRVLNFASRHDIDIEKCLNEKILINKKRKEKHGRKVI